MNRKWNFAEQLALYGPDTADRPVTLADARAYCARVTRAHYENFTVASWLLPRALLPHFEAVYSYCRWADDLGDETGGGKRSLDLLAWWRGELDACYDDRVRHPVFVALRETIRWYRIPREPFQKLLVAFEQDQRVPKYDTFDQLLGYCRKSATPVGHLVLYLFKTFDDTKAALANEICTGLQLANFWQDVARDFQIGRVYLPAEDRIRFGVTEEQIAAGKFNSNFRELLKFQVDRTRGYFERGRPLLKLLPKAARIDVELFAAGGEAVLRAIEKQDYDVLTRRPRIGKWMKARLLLRALMGW